MSLMEQFANPDMIDNLSMGDKLAGAGITTLMGMGITFIVLILLWACIALMTKFTYRPKQSDEITKPMARPHLDAMELEIPEPPAADDSLIAVISAAIAACEGGSSNDFIVRKIRRVSDGTNTWGNAGRMDCIDSRKF